MSVESLATYRAWMDNTGGGFSRGIKPLDADIKIMENVGMRLSISYIVARFRKYLGRR